MGEGGLGIVAFHVPTIHHSIPPSVPIRKRAIIARLRLVFAAISIAFENFTIIQRIKVRRVAKRGSVHPNMLASGRRRPAMIDDSASL